MSRGARKEGLSRRHRYTARDSFRALLGSPRKFRGALAVLHVATVPSLAARFGISVPKRAAKAATCRNHIKRRARELFRRHPLKHARLDLVVTLTNGFKVKQSNAMIEELSRLMDEAGSRLAP